MSHNGENKKEFQMKKKPLSLRLKQKFENLGYLIRVILVCFTYSSNWRFWCKLGLHKNVSTIYGDYQCTRCGRWAE